MGIDILGYTRIIQELVGFNQPKKFE